MLNKILEADLEGKGVKGQPDVPGLSAAVMQEKVEELVRAVVVPAFNNMVDLQNTENENRYTKKETDQAINEKMISVGAGDMAKSVYDKDGDGVVDNSKMLGGRLPAEYLTHPNLLDNSDFANPVNQRGVSGKIAALGYFLDRWKLVSGTVTLTAAGIVLNGTIAQLLEQEIGALFVASSNAGEPSYNDATRTFTLTAAGQTIRWAKLEKGSIATLCLPKGYGAELAECMRFYQERSYRILMGNLVNPTSFPIGYYCPMRITPTVTLEPAVNGVSVGASTLTPTGFNITISAASIDASQVAKISADL